MKSLLLGIFIITISSCSTTYSSVSGTDTFGANVTVYRDIDGQVTKHVRDTDSSRVIVYYKK
mgnify:CR=1 FL=1